MSSKDEMGYPENIIKMYMLIKQYIDHLFIIIVFLFILIFFIYLSVMYKS